MVTTLISSPLERLANYLHQIIPPDAEASSKPTRTPTVHFIQDSVDANKVVFLSRFRRWQLQAFGG
jgi:hypothetical protein